MIYVGIDDTDTLDTPGTNQLAKELARLVADDFRCHTIVRHQLFFDPRVPYTSKNGSASLCFEPLTSFDRLHFIQTLEARMRQWFVPGSDPGLCVATEVTEAITAFGHRAKTELVTQQEAHRLAEQHGIYLAGLGGTCGGVIGALAAVGLIVTQNDGRLVQCGRWPDDLSGRVAVELLQQRDVDVRDWSSDRVIDGGIIDVGKHLRPNLRQGRSVVFAEKHSDAWVALKLV